MGGVCLLSTAPVTLWQKKWKYTQLINATETDTMSAMQSNFKLQTSTLFHKTIGYNRLARKIAIANLGGPVKRKINWMEKKGKEKEGKLQF